jgi:hypothetical protein
VSTPPWPALGLRRPAGAPADRRRCQRSRPPGEARPTRRPAPTPRRPGQRPGDPAAQILIGARLRRTMRALLARRPDPPASSSARRPSSSRRSRGPSGRDGLDGRGLGSAGGSVPLRVGAAVGAAVSAPNAAGGDDRLDGQCLGSAALGGVRVGAAVVVRVRPAGQGCSRVCRGGSVGETGGRCAGFGRCRRGSPSLDRLGARRRSTAQHQAGAARRPRRWLRAEIRKPARLPLQTFPSSEDLPPYLWLPLAKVRSKPAGWALSASPRPRG